MIGQHLLYIVQRQQFALNDISSYTPGPVDWKLGRKYWGDLYI